MYTARESTAKRIRVLHNERDPMKKSAHLLALLLAVAALATPAFAGGRHQSYFTYDDGGTTIRTSDDNREVEARVNQPVFPGDEVTTSRRGRSEIRLSDGNVIGLDRSSAIHFRSIVDSYEGEGAQTVVELRYGHIMVQRTDRSGQALRLDTDSASYVTGSEAIYSVDSDGRGAERVTVFDGSVEVRTPQRSSRLRAGEEARVDAEGVYRAGGLARNSADDFERWFIRRAERSTRVSSRYLDRSLAYSDYDLEENGSWVFAASYGGWCWRPHVSAGWRPYYNGSWSHSRYGSLTWVSYEPWGWVPYHYGRWASDPAYGWVWLPGAAYAPAWVYWMYGPSYIGWAPMGWYDCYRPYYDWAYRPYARAGFDIGFGFYGRVRVNEVDLRPWTFVDANTIVSTRVDRAAITTDIIRQRLARNPGGFATVSGQPARFSRNELRDPAAAVDAITRRGIGSGTGKESPGSQADMTPFFRRDPELSTAVRDRIVRNRPADASRPGTASGLTGGSVAGGSAAPVDGRLNRGDGGFRRGGDISGGGPAVDGASGRINRGSGEQIDRGSSRPVDGATIDRGSGRINRGSSPDRGFSRDADGQNSASASSSGGWRERIDRPSARPPADEQIQTPASSGGEGIERTTPSPDRGDGGWRSRNGGSQREGAGPQRGGWQREGAEETTAEPRGSDVPRRIIDSIGGARVYRGEGGDASSSRGGDTTARADRQSPPPRHESASPREQAPREQPSRESSPRERPSRESAPREQAPRHESGERVHRDPAE